MSTRGGEDKKEGDAVQPAQPATQPTQPAARPPLGVSYPGLMAQAQGQAQAHAAQPIVTPPVHQVYQPSYSVIQPREGDDASIASCT